jgi:hypothetical protein
VFRRNCIESWDHLFFLCSFSARIRKECMKRCNVPSPCFDWQALIMEGCRSWKTKSMFGVICRLAISSIVYGIWRAACFLWFWFVFSYFPVLLTDCFGCSLVSSLFCWVCLRSFRACLLVFLFVVLEFVQLF